MSLMLLEGFEDLALWGTTSSSIVTGRTGNCILITGGGSATYNIPIGLQTAQLTIGVAFRPLAMSAGNNNILDCKSDAGNTSHVTVTFSSSGQLALVTGGTTRYSSANGFMVSNSWYYIELQTVLSDTGSATLRMNGTVLYTNATVDTKNGGTKTVFDTIQLYDANPNTNNWDDFYAFNSIETFWGDTAIETLYPDGMDTTAWVGSDGDAVNNHLLVNEAGTPVDTTYTQSSTVAARELYTCQNMLRTSGTILGVQVNARANKSDSGARGLKVVAKESGGAIRSTADNALTTTFADYSLPLEKKNDASAWTVADVNALGIGVEVGS